MFGMLVDKVNTPRLKRGTQVKRNTLWLALAGHNPDERWKKYKVIFRSYDRNFRPIFQRMVEFERGMQARKIPSKN